MLSASCLDTPKRDRKGGAEMKIQTSSTMRRNLAVAFLFSVALGCNDLDTVRLAADNPEGDSAPSLDLTGTTATEIGVESLGLWNPLVGGYRGWALVDGKYRYWTGDNSLMLWAFSKGDYALSRQNGHASALRDYLMDMESDGLFSEGRQADPATGVVSETDPRCSPAMETQVLWGIVAFTRNWSGIGGRRAVDRYPYFINRVLTRQHQRVMAREAGRPCARSGTQNQHDFTNPATVAFHILNAATWYKETGNAKYQTFVQEAWGLLKSRTLADGTFITATLRNSQILYALTETLRLGLNPSGMRESRDRLLSVARKAADGGLYYGSAVSHSDLDTQGLAYHFLSLDTRPFTVTAFLRNRICTGGGYAFLGRGGATVPGPIEDQGMGLLGQWWIVRQQWGENGATCFVP